MSEEPNQTLDGQPEKVTQNIESQKKLKKVNFTLGPFSIDFTLKALLIFFTGIILVIAIVLLISIIQYFIFFRGCELTLLNGKINFNCTGKKAVIVSPNIGLQNSGIYLKSGEHYYVNAKGAVHVSGYQPDNRVRAIRCVIYTHLDETQRKKWFRKFDSENVETVHECSEYSKNHNKKQIEKEWYRHWTSNEGESGTSNTFGGTKFLDSEDWGALLMVILPIEADTFEDPFVALERNNLTTASLIPVKNSKTFFTANSDGYLHFIINDAVLSKISDSERASDFFAALETASSSGYDDKPQQVIPERIPLYLYGDNRGYFSVEINY